MFKGENNHVCSVRDSSGGFLTGDAPVNQESGDPIFAADS